jgi:hypothetical protein
LKYKAKLRARRKIQDRINDTTAKAASKITLDCTSFERKPYMLITDKYYIVMDIHGGVC